MGETKRQIERVSDLLDCTIGRCDYYRPCPKDFESYASATKSLAETLVLLQQVAANESAQRLTDAIMKKYESTRRCPSFRSCRAGCRERLRVHPVAVG